MNHNGTRNIAAFVRQRLLNFALALTPEFFEDSSKQAQWKAFLRKGKLRADKKTFNEVAVVLKKFLMPPILAIIDKSKANHQF